MSNLIPFQFENKEIRTVVGSSEVWVVAKDVCEALEYKWQPNLIGHVPEKWKGINPINTPGGTQEMAVLSEQGLYFFLGRSDKPKALPLQMWVAGEVLPSIRKTGSYSLSQPVRPQPTAMDVADWVLAKLPNLCERSRQEIVSRTANQIVGFEMLPLPKVEEKFWTAGELAEEFGVTANKIGRLANSYGLKDSRYGEHRLSKSRHSAKQVEQFYYNEKGRAALARLVLEIATH